MDPLPVVVGVGITGVIAARALRLYQWNRACAALPDVESDASFFALEQLRSRPPSRPANIFAWGGGKAGPSAWRIISTCNLDTLLDVQPKRMFSGESDLRSGDKVFDDTFLLHGDDAALIRDLFAEASVREGARILLDVCVRGLHIDAGGRATISLLRLRGDAAEARTAMTGFVEFLDLLESFVEDAPTPQRSSRAR